MNNGFTTGPFVLIKGSKAGRSPLSLPVYISFGDLSYKYKRRWWQGITIRDEPVKLFLFADDMTCSHTLIYKLFLFLKINNKKTDVFGRGRIPICQIFITVLKLSAFTLAMTLNKEVNWILGILWNHLRRRSICGNGVVFLS